MTDGAFEKEHVIFRNLSDRLYDELKRAGQTEVRIQKIIDRIRRMKSGLELISVLKIVGSHFD